MRDQKSVIKCSIIQLTALPNLLQLLASRSGALPNNSDLSRSLGLNVSTLLCYMALLELFNSGTFFDKRAAYQALKGKPERHFVFRAG